MAIFLTFARMLAILIAYFLLLMLLSRLISRGAGSNAMFYRGERRSSWMMVAFGMIGASLSGVSFVSVPGMTIFQDMTYLQTCLGFILGYFIVAFVLLPLYYRLNLTSIYECLAFRKIAAGFFILSDLLGSAVKFYLFCIILQRFVFDALGVPFLISVPLMVVCIWLYTRHSGVRTLVFSDVLQTLCMIAALLFIIINVCRALDMNLSQAMEAICSNNHSRIFVFDDFVSTQNFWKQFLSGAFIVVVMTGLNQNMMQKNLSCRSLRDAQKDMAVGGFFFVPLNLLFMALGVLLIILADRQGMTLPESGDDLLPMFIMQDGGQLGWITQVFFVLGIVSAAFSSADSSLTALTTSFCIDIAERADDERLRRRVHLLMAAALVLLVYALQFFGSKSLIDLVYILVSYTYGPLLGLFIYSYTSGRLGKNTPDTDNRRAPWVLAVCIASPVVCYLLNAASDSLLNYRFGYELLLINAALTWIGVTIAQHHQSEASSTKSLSANQSP